jgi:4-alpha-glucanotransferase
MADNPRPDGGRVAYRHALKSYDAAVDEVHSTYRKLLHQHDPRAILLEKEMHELRDAARWLRDDALYEALTLEHGSLSWHHWPRKGEGGLDNVLCASPAGSAASCAHRRQTLEEQYSLRLERYALGQLLLLRQHRAFRDRMQTLGLQVYGDLQVGFSLCDTWSLQGLLLHNYYLGAPPSRTTVEGQPWSYQVLDPSQFLDTGGNPGPVLKMVAERLGKMLAEFDGLRLDHPHGLVCPWVYRADDPDPFHAVQHGARLFSSPDLPDHPELARYALVNPDQLNRSSARYADDWLQRLTPEQEDHYALIMDALMEQVLANGRRTDAILCEVLSTEPLPLRQVRLRHGLGRFRVTQKDDPDNPQDVYLSVNAEPQDWIMMGNHDTPSIWRLARSWQGTEKGRQQAAYLARRLKPSDPDPLQRTLAADHRRLVHAKAADLFLSPARHIMLFFADLFGLEESYNLPGTLHEDNWTLRVPHDCIGYYEAGKQRGETLNLYAVLALALRARSDLFCPELIAQLDERAGWTV